MASLAVFTVVATGLLAVAYLTDFAKFGTFTRYQTVLANGSVFVAVALPAGSVAGDRAGVSEPAVAPGGRGAVGHRHVLAAGEPPADSALLCRAHGARTARANRVLVAQGDIVIVAAHSQGTVIAAATLLQADER